MRSGSSSSSSRFKIRPKQVNASTCDFDRCCLQWRQHRDTLTRFEESYMSTKATAARIYEYAEPDVFRFETMDVPPKTQAVRLKPQTMKAIQIHNYGGPEVLKYEDAPRPKPQAGEVLVRVHAAGVNPIDWKVREGHMKEFWPHKFPLILGWDLSGVVEELGKGVSRFKIGDEVYSIPDPTRGGAYADYIVVRESELALKPKSLHHIRAGAVPLAALTAWQSLFDAAQLQSGQRVLIHAGSGGVGHFAVQLAKWKGVFVYDTATTENQDLLRKL